VRGGGSEGGSGGGVGAVPYLRDGFGVGVLHGRPARELGGGEAG
jgi:hypothetical protein